MFKPTKRDLQFFNLFSNVMDDTCTAAEILQDLFTNFTDVDEKIKSLETLEHKCDKTVHDLIEQLNRAFVTPLDREDIFVIAKVIDNIMDAIESTAHRLRLFNIESIRPESGDMCRLISQCTRELRIVVNELRNMKSSRIMHEKIVEVNRIENQGDETYRGIVRYLFLNEKNPLEIIKWKEIFEYMEHTLDACEDVANIIEGIVSKNA